MRLLKGSAMVFLGGGVAAMVWAALAPGSLTVNGKTVSTDFVDKGGRTYVPLADVAKALDMTVQKSGSGYTLAPIGGANQLEGQRGKVGDVLQTPEFTFQVKKLVSSEHYQKMFGTDPKTVDAQHPGDAIVGVVIRIKNKTNRVIYLSPFGQDATGLTDEDEHVYAQFTGGWADLPPGDHKLIPGSAIDFALVFEVPEKAKLKDLVYQFDGIGVAHNIVRVSVEQPDGGSGG
ncbi:MAG TPA: hypothetical protein VMI31_08790 [Fimbriimonadaceae bacterium]|nr:hypothetical protein [Fimbriimonadaceae bacterium]